MQECICQFEIPVFSVFFGHEFCVIYGRKLLGVLGSPIWTQMLLFARIASYLVSMVLLILTDLSICCLQGQFIGKLVQISGTKPWHVCQRL